MKIRRDLMICWGAMKYLQFSTAEYLSVFFYNLRYVESLKICCLANLQKQGVSNANIKGLG